MRHLDDFISLARIWKNYSSPKYLLINVPINLVDEKVTKEQNYPFLVTLANFKLKD